MSLDGVEALVIKHGLYEAAGGWIAVNGSDNVGAEGFAKRALVLKCVVISLTDEVGRHIGMREPLADPMGNRSFQRVVVKNVFVDKSGELRFMARHLFGFATNARPDRIDFIEAPPGPRLKLDHG